MRADLGLTTGWSLVLGPWTLAKRPSFLSLRVRRGERASITFLGHIGEGGDGETGYGLEGWDGREACSRGHFQTQDQSYRPC